MAVNLNHEEEIGENSANSEEDTRTEIRKELANMSFEEIQKLKEKLGAKVFNEAYHGRPLRARTGSKALLKSGRVHGQPYGKRGKHAPREESSKMRVPSVRDVIAVPKVVRRDPRFDGVSGTYDEKAWKKNYKFVGDIKTSEKTQLKEQLRKESDPSEKKKLKVLLQRLQNQEKAEKEKEKKEAEAKMEREENIARLKQGKKPIYKAKSVKKKEELAEKFIELKESGRLDKYLQKKRKKMAGKSKKQLMSS
ncbi:ribosomal RNA processing protein 36 homolog [Amphibalanus amphitrite]|uniref:ribosomal RNA processing protein 36 homolog n=1 Tax=Amphibalanus amphitrite TaxID=1232801 RepID=UPI001C912DB8|nr:ribosomal RNA processing protein 36 homolog [Amphibalanus amphitrite]XP_043236873.1 ribosomal RNA processing protein 36 homolog [Amphibalanus amphitrite]XP_043236875.1 ribosomal RNA processing protein 36 homolog [Amphibalanus amphitrite]XP_043236876.1 ribosomal RNA processing protein 36 homolog [Amphibalanus amphitrite]